MPRDLRRPDHLPNLRPGGRAQHYSWLPRQRRGTTPQMVGRYPDFDVLEEVDRWDEATKRVVLARLDVDRELRFFGGEEVQTARLFCDVCTGQDDEPRVPVLELVDAKLAAGQLDGYQYADMPDDRDTWHLALAGLDEVTRSRHGLDAFAELGYGEAAHDLVGRFSRGELDSPSFARLNVQRAWKVCSRMVLAAFYSHPWAWNEIGFGGPAYPRGFMRLGPLAVLEPFERPGATSEDPVEEIAEGEPAPEDG